MTDLAGPIAAYPSPPNYHSPPQLNPSIASLYDRAAMASSLSPNPSSQSGYGSGLGGAAAASASSASPPDAQDKSPLASLNLGFLKTLTDKRTTRDGNPPKRRGPKPDSKPALTRRQELNRQAQRTHRERKELYIKALEDEVLRLKEIYSNISRDKERLAEENRQLKALMAQSGMSIDDAVSNPSIGAFSSSGSVSGSYGQASSRTSAFTPPPLSGGGHQQHMRGVSPQSQGQGQGQQQQQQQSHRHHQAGLKTEPGQGQGGRSSNIDYEQAGIDFVLTLEKPCMDHLPWLLERGAASAAASSPEGGGMGIGEPCGHALMASCPPEPFPELTPDIPFGYSNVSATPFAGAQHGGHSHGHGHNHDHNPKNSGGGANRAKKSSQGPATAPDGSGQRTWELTKADLATLLDLSQRLNLDGEITPVMAWGMVLAHPRLAELRAEDFVRLTEELSGKVRCYGFGAVMEEFEVRDALENVFSTKPDVFMTY